MPTVNHKPLGNIANHVAATKRRARALETKRLGTASAYMGGPAWLSTAFVAPLTWYPPSFGPAVTVNVGSSGFVYVFLTADILLAANASTSDADAYVGIAVDGVNPTFDGNNPANVNPFACHFGYTFSPSTSSYINATVSGAWPYQTTPGNHLFSTVAMTGASGVSAIISNPSLIVLPG